MPRGHTSGRLSGTRDRTSSGTSRSRRRGLLNATFGNAAELIIALFALSKGLTGVVKASITGSIIGNILLVLGLSFLSGGIKYSKQQFNRTAASISATALTLAAIALIIPTIFSSRGCTSAGCARWLDSRKEQALSLPIAIVLFLTYALVLIFTLVTHKELFGGIGSQGAAKDAGAELTRMGAEEGAHAPWSIRKALIVLLVATAFVALVSEFLVGAIEQARETLGLTEVFVGVIVVAIVGNAAEHSSAILMAIRNKMDISIGIAVGSGLQIALFVAPLLVFASYLFGNPMNLEFTIPEVVAVVASIIIVEQICADGENGGSRYNSSLGLCDLSCPVYFLPDVHVATNAVPEGAVANPTHP